MRLRAISTLLLSLLLAAQAATSGGRQSHLKQSRACQAQDCDPPLIRTIFDIAEAETLAVAWEWIVRDSLGYDLMVWHTNMQGVPPVDSLNSVDLVIWTTGGDTLSGPGDTSCITPEEATTLLTYLTDPPPGVFPRLYLESLDYLDELSALNALSPLATALGIDAVDSLDLFTEEFTVYPCGPPGSYRHFEGGFHTPPALRFNQTDAYQTIAGVTRNYVAVDPGDETRTVAHFYSPGDYTATFSTFLLSSMAEHGDRKLYPGDPVSYVRLSLSQSGKPPVFTIGGPDPGGSTITVTVGDTIRLDTAIGNCMHAPYRDRTPGQKVIGFGLHGAVIDSSGYIVQSFSKHSIKQIAADAVEEFACEWPLSPEVTPGTYLLRQELGYVYNSDVLAQRGFRLVVQAAHSPKAMIGFNGP
jgi:hypothetical protein